MRLKNEIVICASAGIFQFSRNIKPNVCTAMFRNV